MFNYSSTGQPPVPPGSQTDLLCTTDKTLVSPTENEITLQWYHPSLEEADPARPEASGVESRVLLMYAMNSKTTGGANGNTRMLWVSLSQLNDLHDRSVCFLALIWSKYRPTN